MKEGETFFFFLAKLLDVKLGRKLWLGSQTRVQKPSPAKAFRPEPGSSFGLNRT